MKKLNSIQELMQELGFTQDQVAEHIGMSRRNLNYKLKNPKSMSVEEGKKLSELFKITLESLYGLMDGKPVKIEEA